MSDVTDLLNKLAKWRSVFAGWQLGTRTTEDPESNAVRDHREVTILLRAEVSALVGVLVKRGVFSLAEYNAALAAEAVELDRDYEKFFPGFRTMSNGVDLTLPQAAETMKRMNFKP